MCARHCLDVPAHSGVVLQMQCNIDLCPALGVWLPEPCGFGSSVSHAEQGGPQHAHQQSLAKV